MGIESIKYYDICDDCLHKSYCDMAQFGGHNPHITACYHFTQSKRTNADRVRAMTNGEIEDWYWWMHKEMMYYTDSRAFVHNWLKQEVDDG